MANPAFEVWDATNEVVDWTRSGSSSTLEDFGECYQGRRCVSWQVNNNLAGSWKTVTSSSIDIDPADGLQFYLSGVYRSNSAQMFLKVYASPNAGGGPYTEIVGDLMGDSANWEKLERVFTAPDGTQSLQVQYATNVVNGVFYTDTCATASFQVARGGSAYRRNGPGIQVLWSDASGRCLRVQQPDGRVSI